MRLRLIAGAMLVALGMAAPAQAEEIELGEIVLTGLARDSWPLNPPGEQFAMVCNVSVPDGFLAIRSGPGTQHKIKRRLKLLAILTVDTSHIEGKWVRVLDAHHTHSLDGFRIKPKPLAVQGWAHSDYLCDFLD